jgi:hypothetical protein
MLFERHAIAWLKEATPAAVARRLGITWEEANGIVERAVVAASRGAAPSPGVAWGSTSIRISSISSS